MVALAFACVFDSIRAKLHYSRVRFAAKRFGTVRTQNKADARQFRCELSLLIRRSPERRDPHRL